MPHPQTDLPSILVADEEKDYFYFIRKTLEPILPGFTFCQVLSAEEAALVASNVKPRLIITEVYFWNYKFGKPDRAYAGPWLIRKLQKETPESKIIICSTQPEGCFGDWYVKDWSVAAYFIKPFNLRQLVEKTCELLKIPYNINPN